MFDSIDPIAYLLITVNATVKVLDSIAEDKQ